MLKARFVIIATGAGAFTPVKVRAEGMDEFEPHQVCYQSLPDTTKRKTTVIGDTESAINTALKCVESAESVTYIHRKKRLSGSEQLQHKLHTLHEQGKLCLLYTSPSPRDS